MVEQQNGGTVEWWNSGMAELRDEELIKFYKTSYGK